MGRYISWRLLISIPVLVGITFISFLALSLAPGDPLTARVDPSILAQQSPEVISRERHELGLDQPLPVRYIRWLQSVLHGSLGYSIVSHRSILSDVEVRLPATLQLMGTALLIGIVVGLLFGIVTAVRQYSWLDYFLTTFTMMAISTPTFFLGLVGIYVFGVDLHLLPTADMVTFGAPPSLADRLRHLVLPATILGTGNAALLMRYTRESMLTVLRQEYITTARSKGLSLATVVLRHGLRNALLPVITILGLLIPELVAGAIITEQIFAWPGMGLMAVRAASDRDPSLLMGVVLIVGIGVLLANLLADIAYAVADPQIRYR